MIVIDNTPFPDGKPSNYSINLLLYLGPGKIEVMIMKENIYTTDMSYYTASYSLILVFSMLFIVILGLSFRYH